MLLGMSTSESKEQMRTEARRHRSFIDPGSEDPEKAAEYFFSSIDPKPNQIIAAYWPKGREFDCGPIIEGILKAGNTCGLPVVQDGTRELKFAKWTEDINLVSGAFGVHHPPVEGAKWVEPDIVVVPMLAFDRRGYRLGHGGGYYDATLAALRKKKEILAVGVAYGQQAVLFNLPVEDHDQRLDWVITPKGTHYFE